MNKTIEHGNYTNVGFSERIVSLLAGSLLVVNAFERKTFSFSKAAVGGFLLYRGISGHCPVSKWTAGIKIPSPQNINIRTGITVNRPRHEVYSFWRNFSNLPLFMQHVEKVEKKGDNLWYWKIRMPGGLGSLSWDATVVKEEPENLLGWSSVEGSAIEAAGKIMFNIARENATRLDIVISYRAPFGAAGEQVARLLNPAFEKMVRKDIEQFKAYFEKRSLPLAEL
jgi:uncharacterized membrane protein